MNEPSYRRTIEDRLSAAIDTEIGTADRVSTLVTETVPSRFQANLLVWLAELGPRSIREREVTSPAIAIELALLHQYVHAIPRAEGSLASPAAESPYATDETAAVLDGDFLQASAFTRLAPSIEDPERATRCYRLLSEASIECYERIEASEGATPSTPLTGAAAAIGAIVGGVDRTTAAAVERTARALGAAIPIETPTGIRRDADRSMAEIEATIDELRRLVRGEGSTDETADVPIETLLCDRLLEELRR